MTDCHPEFGCDCARRIARLEEINVELLRDTAKVELRLLNAEDEAKKWEARAWAERHRTVAVEQERDNAMTFLRAAEAEARTAEARVKALEDLNGNPLPVIVALGGNLRKAEARVEALEAAGQDGRWWRSTLLDVAYALRNQDDLSREEIAEVIDNALARAALACPPQQRGEQ